MRLRLSEQHCRLAGLFVDVCCDFEDVVEIMNCMSSIYRINHVSEAPSIDEPDPAFSLRVTRLRPPPPPLVVIWTTRWPAGSVFNHRVHVRLHSYRHLATCRLSRLRIRENSLPKAASAGGLVVGSGCRGRPRGGLDLTVLC